MQAPMVYRVDKASARLAGPGSPSRVARHGSAGLRHPIERRHGLSVALSKWLSLYALATEALRYQCAHLHTVAPFDGRELASLPSILCQCQGWML
jgi:hypothetical protein